MKILIKVLIIIWKIIKGIFLTYAVLFSVTLTAFIVYTALYVSKPFLAVKKLKTENPVQTLYMKTYRHGLHTSKQNDTLMHSFVSLDSIPSVLIKAVIAAEDDGFYTHPGFDLVAIIGAYEYNREKNGMRRGASTITQQLAKNLFAGGEKKYTRKYVELAYTVLLENVLGKDRILELYLNYAQWGKNIFGCEAASQYYYKIPCKSLTFDQAVRLAAILAKPCKSNPHNENSIFINKRMRVIGDNLYRRHTIDDSTYVKVAKTDSLIRLLQQKNPDTLSARADSL